MQVYFLNDNQHDVYCIGLEKLSVSSNHVFVLINLIHKQVLSQNLIKQFQMLVEHTSDIDSPS